MNSYSAATVVTADSIEKEQRRLLRRKLAEALENKKLDAKRKFGLRDDEAPETISEAVQRIKDGKFIIKKNVEDAFASMSFISWRDPSVKEDKAGYKAERATLVAEYEKLDTRLAILPLADALKELEAYIG